MRRVSLKSATAYTINDIGRHLGYQRGSSPSKKKNNEGAVDRDGCFGDRTWSP